MAEQAPPNNGKKGNARRTKSNGSSKPERRASKSKIELMAEDDDDYSTMVDDARAVLAIEYGTAPMSPSEIVLVMQGWNKVLAFTTMFSEALSLKWRHMVHPDTYSKKPKKMWRAIGKVERNEDLLALCMGPRLQDLEELLIGFLDGVFRSFCPKEQRVSREAYRPIQDDVTLIRKEGEMTLECESVEDYTRLFARCGVEPHYWIFFCEAFLWCMKTHVPYGQDDDAEDLENGRDSAYAKAIRITAMKAIDGYVGLRSQMEKDIFQKGVTRFWARLDQPTRLGFGEQFYRTLLAQNPQMLDFFSKTDMDSLAIHFMATLDLLVKSIRELGTTGNFRKALDMLAEVHRQRRIPTFTYAIVGAHLLECLKGSLEAEEQLTKDDPYPVTAKQLTQAYAVLYTEVMSIVYYPMLLEEKKVAKALDFYEKIQVELNWTGAQLRRRMLKVEQEIAASGTYTQTAQEIELGARLAWRNSAKCIGRISWNTLQVRDCRKVTEPMKIFEELNEHLRIATAGTNIQSVMTVFKPQGPNETLGTRFWSSQIVRYACYKNLDGSLVGDPANLELTEYLLANELWDPPETTTPFDVLPLVLKKPGRKIPYIYEVPKEFIFEVNIEHPTRPEVLELGYKWTTVPAITNFKMNLGGVVYANIPFNGWFVSTEIVRNLMERYSAGAPMAKIMGIDPKVNPFWEQMAYYEWEVAVLHSFQKNGFTIVDPNTVGKSFCTHVRREREDFGRECPGQWSWIGGLVGPTNPTWHLEMRDFLLFPQYEYCMEGVAFYGGLAASESKSITDGTATTDDMSVESFLMKEETARLKVLISYGSETGNAEAAARRLKRELQLLKPTVIALNDLAKDLGSVKKRSFTHVVFLCSTFGKGQPPSNAEDFFAKQIPPGMFGDVKYAVLAFGSTLYPDFCKAGSQLDRKISTNGGTKMIPVNKIDDAAGGDGDIVEWISLVKRMIMPPHVEEEIAAAKRIMSGKPPENVLEWTGQTAPESKYPDDAGGCMCILNEELVPNHEEGSKSIRKITFQLPPTSKYETGDHLCVYPVNRQSMVERFLKCFEFELSTAARSQENYPHKSNWFKSNTNDSVEEAVKWQSEQMFELYLIENDDKDPSDVFFPTPICLRDLLKQKVDLSLSARNVVDLLALFQKQLDEFSATLEPEILEEFTVTEIVHKFYSTTATILEQDADKTTDAVDAFIANYPSIVAFLEDFKELFLLDFGKDSLGLANSNVMMPLAEVLVILPRLQPRYYSISSSSNTGKPSEVTVTVGVLKTTTSKGVPIEGVCSHYLAGLQAGKDRAKISVSTSSFRLPEDGKAPILMVGTGTGLSPLMGFLEDKAAAHKKSKKDVGPIHLFFGCRTETDFIYKDLIESLDKDKIIELHLALSRSKEVPKKYVQHKIADMGKRACDILKHPDSHYYVCGDARMADACFEACIGVLRVHGVMSRVAAVQYLKQMQLEGRWQTDVWGIVSHFEDAKKSIEEKKRMKAKLWLSRLAGGEDD
ncbi:Nitric oxide synthase [Seminavis robusta]|uniref:Nitric oxide synthase n=1 Tax=Seminavis robusta TaxID=568900 RepID=A0A9N8H9Z2_9STRA|nr:Nitric oxide synthase [Seminavis robusta]|eukprot:Sro208_g087080.1 Nitric oxide synthase (1496) ;mRNA; r:46709-51196